MLDHVTIGVGDVALSRKFYDLALAPLGIECLYAESDVVGYGVKPNPFFWVGQRADPQTSVHIAFAAKDRATVTRFHEAALAAGGRDNGPPGFRPDYHPNYYAAFVFDPDGHNIEAVCHAPVG
jgi:catechol 2,3-dioxygenase-like lactoylglutathione lyase family enzyme